MQTEQLMNTKPPSYTSQYSMDSNNSENIANSPLVPPPPKISSNTQPFQSKENFLPPPFIPAPKKYPSNINFKNPQALRNIQNQTFISNNYQQNGHHQHENIMNHGEIENFKNFYPNQFPNSLNLNPAIYQNLVPNEFKQNMNFSDFQKFQMKLPQTSLNEEYNGLIENVMNDPVALSQLAMNNEKLRL